MCPCELHAPPQSKTEPALSAGPETEAGPANLAGLQDPNKIATGPAGQTIGQSGQMGQTQLIGPAGESSLVETGETYAHAATKQIRFSSTIGTSTDRKSKCACQDKHGKKKKKVICECPPEEPKPEPEPEPLLPSERNFEWVDQAQINKMKSGMTETTSGFKINVKKQPPPPPSQTEPEFSLDDAIRYYASMKPELFRDIMEEHQKKQDRPDFHARQSGQDKNPDVNCECTADSDDLSQRQTGGTGGPGPSESEPSEPVPSEITQEEEGPFKGLKFKIGGKGSGSPGLAGICCFDMLQESFTTW